MDDTIQSLKDSIRQEVISYQKNIKNENKFSNNNKYFNQKKQNSKAQISDYFNKIKINSKINLSNNLSLNERNYDNNKLIMKIIMKKIKILSFMKHLKIF